MRISALDERLQHFLLQSRFLSISLVWRYGLAVLVSATPAALLPWLGVEVPYSINLLAVILATVLFGPGPGLLTVMLGGLAYELFVMETFGAKLDGAAAARLCVSISIGIFLSYLLHAIRAAQAKLKETNVALEQERDLLGAVMNGAGNSHLLYLDRDFNFVRVNETYARSCGYKPEEMIGKNHFVLYPHTENEAIFARVRDSGVPEEYHDKPFAFPDQPERGTTYWDWTLIPVKDNGGIVKGLVFSLTETTERRLTEERLRLQTVELTAANNELESFSYSVSHDLRNLLNGILACGEVLNSYQPMEDEGNREALQHILRSSHRMSQVISDLLCLSRIARQEVRCETISLSDIASDICVGLARSDPRRKVEIAIEPDLSARADAGLTRILLENLLANSWKFTSNKELARIEFRSQSTDKAQVYFLRDNGVGFDMALSDRLFKPFQRLHSEKQFAGTGIGLATVKRIVDKHGGAIWVEAEQNRGATIYFQFN